MTITVTVEELRAYENAVEKWAKARAAAFEEAALQLAEKHHDLSAQKGLANREVHVAQAIGPMPKLIPSV